MQSTNWTTVDFHKRTMGENVSSSYVTAGYSSLIESFKVKLKERSFGINIKIRETSSTP